MLRLDVRPAKAEVAECTTALVRDPRDLMAAVLPLEKPELEFLERLNGAGKIAPKLLTDDAATQG